MNSLFSFKFTFLPLFINKFLKTNSCPVLLAPRGELISSAFSTKSFKKRVYLSIIRFLGLLDSTTFQATSNAEYDAILKNKNLLSFHPYTLDIRLVPDLSPVRKAISLASPSFDTKPLINLLFSSLVFHLLRTCIFYLSCSHVLVIRVSSIFMGQPLILTISNTVFLSPNLLLLKFMSPLKDTYLMIRLQLYSHSMV